MPVNPNDPNDVLPSSMLPANTMQLYGTDQERGGEAAGRQNASIYYGSSADLGASAADYRNRLKAKLDQPSALANQMTQSSNAQIASQNARAGMGGADTSARNIAETRANQVSSDAAQQAQNQINMANYGKSIGAGISGTEALAAAGAGKGLAGTPTPTPNYGGGIFSSMGSIICTELSKQNKLTSKELILTNKFRESISPEVYYGYLFLAKPVVKLMKRSSLFSSLWVSWAKSIANGRPNVFTKVMIPVCGVIGKIRVRLYYATKS